MNRTYLLLPILTALMLMPLARLYAQSSVTVAEITVQAGDYDRLDVPVTAPLAGVTLERPGTELRLFETTGGGNTAIASQMKAGDPVQLAWILSGETVAGDARTYELRQTETVEMVEQEGSEMQSEELNSGVNVNDTGKELEITIGDSRVLNFRYTPMPVPEGVNKIYSRGGFIHPLRTPGGEVVTRIQPPDHYHHYGVWNPWTDVKYRGEDLDLWNLYKGHGTVRSGKPWERTAGEVFGGFRVKQEHVSFIVPDAGEEVAMNEDLEVNVWNVSPDNDVWLIDFTSTYNAATEHPFTIVSYRYQGFTIRATEKWNDETATLLTSEGFGQGTGNGTRARWVNINGISDTPEGQSGVLMITNPVNFDYPEHIRIWAEGDIFVNYNPAYFEDTVRGEDMLIIKPGESTTLKYRMMIYDGELDAAGAERYWRDFANPPKVEVNSVSEI